MSFNIHNIAVKPNTHCFEQDKKKYQKYEKPNSCRELFANCKDEMQLNGQTIIFIIRLIDCTCVFVEHPTMNLFIHIKLYSQMETAIFVFSWAL